MDFILCDALAVEVKRRGKSITKDDLKGLLALHEEQPSMQKILVSLTEEAPRKIGEVLVLPAQVFLERLWSDRLF